MGRSDSELTSSTWTATAAAVSVGNEKKTWYGFSESTIQSSINQYKTQLEALGVDTSLEPAALLESLNDEQLKLLTDHITHETEDSETKPEKAGTLYVAKPGSGTTRQLTNVAAGLNDTDAVNVAQLKASQTHYYSVNDNGTPKGNYNNDGALGKFSLAAGPNAKAEGLLSTVVGAGNYSQDTIVGSLDKIKKGIVYLETHGNGAGRQIFQRVGPLIENVPSVMGIGSTVIGSMNSVKNRAEVTTAIDNLANNTYTAARYTLPLLNDFLNNGDLFDGIANTVVGTGNETEKANVALIYGTGNTIKNAYEALDENFDGQVLASKLATPLLMAQFGSYTQLEAVLASLDLSNIDGLQAAIKTGDMDQVKTLLLEGYIRNEQGKGGRSVAIGTNNAIENATLSQLRGTNNILVGGTSNSTLADYSILDGYGNKSYKTKNSTIIGNNNTVGASNVNYATNKAIVIGDDNTITARSDNNIVIGTVTDAVGASRVGNIVSVGYNTTLNAANSIGIGASNTVTGTNSIAIGKGHTVTGANSGAFGDPSEITGDSSYAIGNDNTIEVNDGFILGSNASVTKVGGVALGKDSKATTGAGEVGIDTTGENHSDDTTGTWKSTAAAVSVGGGTVTTDDGEGNTTTSTITRQITNVAAGKLDTDVVNVAQLKQVAGGLTHYFSVNATESGTGSNYYNDGAKGPWAIAIGLGAVATNENPTKGGSQIAVGAKSYALGDRAIAIGKGVHAEGDNAIAIGTGEFNASKNKGAYGTNTIAIGENTLVEGNNSTAVGAFSLVTGQESASFGNLAKATADGTTAVGGSSNAISTGASAIGYSSSAGDRSVAIGFGSVAGVTVDEYYVPTGGIEGVERTVAIGAVSKATGNRSTAVGAGAEAIKERSIALGANSVADREKGSYGSADGAYDMIASGNIHDTTDESIAWKSTAAAVSIGGGTVDGKIVTRQITNVAAGSADTDAVNVAQLKAAQVEIIGGDNVEVIKDTSSGHAVYTIHALNAMIEAGPSGNVTVTDEVGDGKTNGVTTDLTSEGTGTTGGNAGTAGTMPEPTPSDNPIGPLAPGEENPNGHTTVYTVDAKDTTYTLSDDGGKTDGKGNTTYTVTLTGAVTGSDDAAPAPTTATIIDTNTTYSMTTTAGTGDVVNTYKITGSDGKDVGVIKDTDTNTTYTIDTEAGKGSIVTTYTVTDSDGKETGKLVDTNTTYTVEKEEGTGNVVNKYTLKDSDGKSVDVAIEDTDTNTTNVKLEVAGDDEKTITLTDSDGNKVTGKFTDRDTRNTVEAGDDTIEVKSTENADGSLKYTITSKAKAVSNVVVEADSDNVIVTPKDEDDKKIYTVDVKTDGKVASGDTGIVTGDTVYNETRVQNDGNYIKKDNTAAENITALDEKVKDNSTRIDNIDNQVNNTYNQINRLDNRMRKGLAGAAALAALHPMDFNPDDKMQFSAGVGNYRGETAAAVGAFYRPDESVMFSIGGTFGNGDNMVNAGITFGLDGTRNRVTRSRTAMAKEIVELRSLVTQMAARMDRMEAANGIETAMFPDVPENHWAYEYVEDLQKRGALKGYPDGLFKGDRAMTRYEFAAMLDRIVRSGITLSPEIAKEFEPELGRIYVERISGQDNDRKKIERVRVNNSDSKYPEGKNRDVYGSKIMPVAPEKAAGK
ncbi:MAG: S-layer homology domain-containing protein [Acidaminococcaceae bacterium]|nr:S-layer homology domain-containing protein [Acidaminococcaceae bacterium]